MTRSPMGNDAGPKPLHQGWLMKRPSGQSFGRDRYRRVTLWRDRVEWSDGDSDNKVRGAMRLSPVSSVTYVAYAPSDEGELVVSSGDRALVMYAPSPRCIPERERTAGVMRAWEAAIGEAVQNLRS
eukprot:338097-Prymnesium_polylepis.1